MKRKIFFILLTTLFVVGCSGNDWKNESIKDYYKNTKKPMKNVEHYENMTFLKEHSNMFLMNKDRDFSDYMMEDFTAKDFANDESFELGKLFKDTLNVSTVERIDTGKNKTMTIVSGLTEEKQLVDVVIFNDKDYIRPPETIEFRALPYMVIWMKEDKIVDKNSPFSEGTAVVVAADYEVVK